MRPNSQQFEICTPAAGEKLSGKFDRAKPATLRVRLEGDSVWFEASQDGKPFAPLGHSKLSARPDGLRVGKVGKAGSGMDYVGGIGQECAFAALPHSECHRPRL